MSTINDDFRVWKIPMLVSIHLLLLTQTFHISGFSLSPLQSSISAQIELPPSFTSITNRQIGILDGSELASLNKFMKAECKNDTKSSSEEKSDFGTIQFVTGTTIIEGTERRVIGFESSSVISTLSTIPDAVSDTDAISTAMASLVAVHCCTPTVSEVAGSEEIGFVSGKTVVLGGGDYACFAARAMDKLGAEVTLVSTGKPNMQDTGVSVMPPVVGTSELGFCEAIGKFDVVLDTLYDESNVREGKFISGSGVVEELRQKHDCQRYISTCNQSQKKVREGGVFFGPSEAKDYEKNIISRVTALSSSSINEVGVPTNFGHMTLQKLLNGNIIYPANKKKDEPIIRGWSLKDFWEYTSWPKDARGSFNSRFGLPVIDDIESIVENYIKYDDVNDMVVEKESVKKKNTFNGNSLVMDIVGMQGLHQNIISQNKNCVLFLSASYCRTCKVINPQYTRMARIAKQKTKNEKKLTVTFAKAETGSKIGKELGKALGVRAVPAFILFRDGKRYGTTLSISKVPSKKLDLAVDYLMSGLDWDMKEFEKL